MKKFVWYKTEVTEFPEDLFKVILNNTLFSDTGSTQGTLIPAIILTFEIAILMF